MDEPMTQLLTTLLAALALGGPTPMDNPRTGIAEVENGVAAPFVGSWRVAFPDGEGVIVNEAIASCDAPVEITAPDDATISYASPQGGSTRFELSAFMDRTSWFPDNGASSIAVWTSADSFYLYPVDPMTGSAGWDNPHVYHRCGG
tara:strand:+ start:11681 stop:12118 length:438 start_codon:yes stop_codon:yes gene_type:complete